MWTEEDLDCDNHEYKDLTKDNSVTPEKDQVWLCHSSTLKYSQGSWEEAELLTSTSCKTAHSSLFD